MNFLANMRIRAKSYGGFGAVCATVIIIVLITVDRVEETQIQTDRVIDLRAPTAKLGVELQNGLNASLANLRGYMLLGNATSKGVGLPSRAPPIAPARPPPQHEFDLQLAASRT